MRLNVIITTQRFISVTLTWTDPKGASVATNAWVNDLDLVVVTTPSSGGASTVYYPNGLFGPDLRNNVEKVTVDIPANHMVCTPLCYYKL